MPERNYITVEELNFYINNIFSSEELLHNVPVVGEVSGCSVVGGHCYFTLKDSAAQIKVVLFNCENKYIPHNGEKVLVNGTVDYYIKGGTINVKAYSVAYFGIGLLAAQYNELKEKLEKEGLFRDEYKKCIPKTLKRIAIITSIKGAAVQDFLTTARRSNGSVDISIIDVRVQGEYCATDIITALNNADTAGYDVIIVARGGGSYEDLFGFNDENLVRAIFNADTPVISAVGHETDYTLCDFVADYRAITPTAAGELIADLAQTQKDRVRDSIKKISYYANKLYENQIENFIDNCDTMQQNIEFMLQTEQLKIKNNLDKIKNFQNRIYFNKNNELTQICSILDKLNPLKLLNNGYFRILKDEKYIYKTAELAENDVITILGIDGEINAEIISGGTENGLRNQHNRT